MRRTVIVVHGAASPARGGAALFLALVLALLPPYHARAQTAEAHAPMAASVAAPPSRAAESCGEPLIEMAPLRAGRTRIAISTPCRAQQLVMLTYAGVILMRWLDGAGRAELVLDCFAGANEPVSFRFEDQTTVFHQPVVGSDMGDLSKVAIVWSSAVDLDLHVFEYGAALGSPGHVWAGQPRSLEEAARHDGRGHGYMSTVANGSEVGMNVEVYTFLHQRGQAPGIIKLAVDYTSRGSKPVDRFCGTGDLSELRFKAYILERGLPLRTLDLAFAAVPCGSEISAGAQINARLIPDLVIRR